MESHLANRQTFLKNEVSVLTFILLLDYNYISHATKHYKLAGFKSC